MLNYKIDVLDELKKKGYTTYTLRKRGLLSEAVISKLRNKDININLETINKLCYLLKYEDVNNILDFKYDMFEEEKILKLKSKEPN